MSQRGVIERTPPKKCSMCGRFLETRPYGLDGKEVCFDCGMKNAKVAQAHFKRVVLGESEH